MKLEQLAEELLPRVAIIPFSGCWIWMGATTKNGYATSTRFGYLHRAVLEAKLGRRLGEELTRHTCDVRCCINPAHLLSGSATDNVNDALSRGRPFGGGGKKLTQQEATEIYAAYWAKEGSQQALANRYGVSARTVSRIIQRKMYRRSV